MEQVVLQGHKGGSSEAHQPVETRNNLLSKSYAKILLAVGEGEFAGRPTAKDIYLDGTPLVSASGRENFGGVKWEFRPGTVDQTHIAGMPDISSEFNVGFTLTSETPYTRQFTDSTLDAFRVTLSWPSLYQQKENGDIVGYNIEYAIDISTDGGPFIEQGKWSTGNGKTTVEYNRTHRLNFPKPGKAWTIQVRRNTPNQNNIRFMDQMQVKTLAEVIDAKLRYPNTALLYVEFDAELFGGTSIPKVSLKTKGRLVQIPSNYDATSRTYSGVWDGTFKWAWCNNPAWIFYDLVINERFGLGSRIKPSMVDKWTLYQVAQYCDVMVPDGAGGMEPRYTCNIYIQARKEAWQVLRDIVAIFNGMLFWSGTQMVASADMPVAVNTVRNYNRANVIDGKFSYSSTSEKTIYTSAMVSYDDPTNHYETAVEPVNDLALVQRYKTWASTELAGIGVTSRGQAQRKGKYTMLTNSLNRLVTFKVGLDGYLPVPGQVIGVADQVLAGSNFSGRISNATANTVTVDRVPNAAPGDILYINKADGLTGEGRTIRSVVGNVITVTADYSAVPSVELGWYIEKSDLKSQLYRVTKVTWSDEEGQYEIQGAQYEDSKYNAVDNGARLEARPITVIPAGGQDAPTGLTLSSFSFIEQTLSVTTLSVKWNPTDGAMNYEAQWRKDGGDWLNVGLTASTGFDVKGIYSGAYQARVRAINAIGTKSLWTESQNTQFDGKVGEPPTVVAFKATPIVFGIKLEWSFPEGTQDTLRTEIDYGTGRTEEALSRLGDYAYPVNNHTMMGLRAGQQFAFRARLVDRSGNVGPWSDFINGQSSADAEEILDYLKDQITKSELGKELLEDIDLINGNAPGSVNARIIEARNVLQGLIDETDGAVSGVKQDLIDQMAAANQALTDAKAALQAQIDGIADLADSLPYKADQKYTTGQGTLGTNGVIYQAKKDVPVNTPPPNSDYWIDVGQAVQTAQGLATRVSTLETSVTDIKGVQTAQASTITGLQSQLNDIASSEALQSLTTRVTSAEGTITSQGTAITNLTNTVNGKADASALNALTTRVTSAEGVNTSQGTAITNLNNSVANKADASALQTLTTRVTATENKNGTQDTAITSQGTAITNLTNSIAGKADASTVSTLSNTVTQQGNTLASQGSAITGITASIGESGSENMVFNPAMVLESTTVPGLALGFGTDGPSVPQASTSVFSLVPSFFVSTERSQRIDVTNLDGSALYRSIRLDDNYTVKALPGQTVTGSIYFRATPGFQYRMYIQARTSNNSAIAAPASALSTTTGGIQRMSYTYANLPDGTANVQLFFRIWAGSVSAGFIEFTRAQLEMGSTLSGWKDNTASVKADAKANAAATTALTSRVSQTETGLTSQSNQITNLTASLTTVGGENLVYNPSFDKASLIPGIADNWAYDQAGGGRTPSLVPSTLDPTGLAQRADFTGMSSTIWQRLQQVNRIKVVPGAYTASVWVKATKGYPVKIQIGGMSAAGVGNNTWQTALMPATGDWQRLWVPVTPDSTTDTVFCAVVVYGTDTVTSGFLEVDRYQLETGTQMSGWKDNTGVLKSDTTANAAATTSLTARVAQTETSITSQSTQLTNLSASLSTAGGENLLYNPSFDEPWPGGPTLIANGWEAFTTATGYTPTLAPSTLDPAGKAQRIEATWAGPNQYVDLAPNTIKFPAVSAGQTLAMSAYVRGTPGLFAQVYFQFFNSSNTLISTDGAAISLPVTTDWTRITRVSAPVPAGAVAVKLLYRGRGPNSGTTTGFFDWDRAQLEIGNAVTGWRDNASVEAAAITANAAATNALTARVTNAEGTLSSVSTSVTNLKASLGSSGGDNLLPNSSFELTYGNPNWPLNWAVGGTSGPPAVQYVDATLPSSTTAVRLAYTNLPSAGYIEMSMNEPVNRPNVTVGESYTLSVWARASSPSVTFQFFIQWFNASGSIIGTNQLNETALTGNFVRYQLTAVAPAGAVKAHVYAGRFWNRAASAVPIWGDLDNIQFEQGASATGYKPSAKNLADSLTATSNAVTTLNATVNSLNGTVSGQASQISNLNTVVGNQGAAIQQTSQVAANTDGAINASYSVKLMTMSNGQKVAAGFGLGLGNESGLTQSQFIVSADRFSVLNSSLQGQTFLPFTVEGGQVFIADAVIKKATITNALIGASLNSLTMTNYGQPVMTADYNAGQITIQNKTISGNYMIIRNDGLFMVSNGVVVVELSMG